MTDRILFITSTRIGDAVLASGLLKRLVDDQPNARFTVACGPLASPLFEHVPRLDQVIPMPKQRLGGHWLNLWAALLPKKWHLVVDIRRSLTGYFLRHGRVLRLQPTQDDRHRVELLSTVLDGGQISDPFIFSSQNHEKRAADLLGGGPILGLGLGASRRDKIWPTERFAAVARGLLQDGRFKGGRVALFGGPGEEPLGALFSDQAEDLSVINLIGQTHLLTAHACFKKLSLFIGNDSGLMHLAASAGCPTVGLFGHTRGHLYGPWGARGTFVQAQEFGPMAHIEVEQVNQSIASLMKSV